MAGERAGSAGNGLSPWLIPAVLVIAGGAALGVIRYYAGSPHEPESSLADVAFAAPSCTAGVLAVAGILMGHRGLVIGAGFALFPISVVSFVMLPLLVPAALLVAYAATLRGTGGALDFAEAALVAVGLPVAFFALLIHDDAATWHSGTSSGSTSDIVTTFEATLSLAITAVVAATAALSLWIGARPRVTR